MGDPDAPGGLGLVAGFGEAGGEAEQGAAEAAVMIERREMGTGPPGDESAGCERHTTEMKTVFISEW
ncbi:hypothetical protein GCM10029992_47330 [Glycomyces albus]